MFKIFAYELRRTAGSWLFFGLLLVNGCFDWYVLSSDIIAGIGGTAPFSVWSCSTYLGKIMPAAAVTVLLLLAGYYGRKQRQAETLIFAAPVSEAWHFIIRTGVLLVCFAMLCLAGGSMAAVFYIRFFGYDQFGVFLLPSLLIAIPCFVLPVGLGHLLGRIHPALIYAEMIFLVFVSVSVENAADFFGAGFYSSYPQTLAPGPDGEPAFVLHGAWIGARMLYFAAGIGLCLLYIHRCGRKAAQDHTGS